VLYYWLLAHVPTIVFLPYRREWQQKIYCFIQIESLIPIKDDRDIKSELEKKRGESYRAALEEHNELVQQLTQKNRILKEIIDSMRGIIWEINTMLAMRDTQQNSWEMFLVCVKQLWMVSGAVTICQLQICQFTIGLKSQHTF